MYVIRRALRVSPARPPARFIRGRRYPIPARLRPLHTTRKLAYASKPPPTSDGTSISEDAASKQAKEKPVGEEATDSEVTAEDPEALAQKLQKSRETSRRYSVALRRQQRAKQSEGLPPIHIPEWFLNKRVIRHDDVPKNRRSDTQSQVLSLSFSDTKAQEHATTFVPTTGHRDTLQAASLLLTSFWQTRLAKSEVHRIKEFIDNVDMRGGSSSSPAPSVEIPTLTSELEFPSTERREAAHSQVRQVEITNEHEEAFGGSTEDVAVQKDDNLSNLGPEGVSGDAPKGPAVAAAELKRGEESPPRVARNISSLVLAEIRATMAASLGVTRPSTGGSFPAVKTNLILHSPSTELDFELQKHTREIAMGLGADMIVLYPQDFAELAGDYLGEGPEPTPRSIRSLAYDTYQQSAQLANAVHLVKSDAEEEQETFQAAAIDLSELPKAFRGIVHAFRSIPMPMISSNEASAGTVGDEPGRAYSQSELQLEDLKLAALLEALVDANETKSSRNIPTKADVRVAPKTLDHGPRAPKEPSFFDYSVKDGAILDMSSIVPPAVSSSFNLSLQLQTVATLERERKTSKIIVIRDFKELNATHYGGRIIQRLEELVRKRRVAGENIMILGTTSCDFSIVPNTWNLRDLQEEGESSSFRTIITASEPTDAQLQAIQSLLPTSEEITKIKSKTSPATRTKVREINRFHITDMLRSLDADASRNIIDEAHSDQNSLCWRFVNPTNTRGQIFSHDTAHRIALTALGLYLMDHNVVASKLHNNKRQLSVAHIAQAIALINASDMVKSAYYLPVSPSMQRSPGFLHRALLESGDTTHRSTTGGHERERDLFNIGPLSEHEKRLTSGIADPAQIKTTFDQVHVPAETIDAIRTMTSLSLLRPDAFNYGILATEKISGALLYGPPGTGKTLLAKAVAKESGSKVLEVSGSQIWNKYVGESEKSVSAVFSLARKLSPCIVFLDEADAIFATRNAYGDNTHHRDVLNQFLKEWDGLNDLSVFVMVATNRPFDLDDAVIRRLPRRLLVDLPTQDDRKEILRIHLRGEQLDETVDLDDLAKRTPFYSGSDLKNVVISAALACVKEENENAARAAAQATLETPPPDTSGTGTSNRSHQGRTASTDTQSTTSISAGSSPPDAPTLSSNAIPSDTPVHSGRLDVPYLRRGGKYTFPPKRILQNRHFDAALQQISASISEDMSSLNAIKKFDELYGDRKGRTKRRKGFGFGVSGTGANESDARIRG